MPVIIGKELMRVLVVGANGIGLMPTTPRKARVLLKCHKAVVCQKKPFTIRLNYKTGCATQHCELGIDTGTQHIGVGVMVGPDVLRKDEWVLRSTMTKRSLIETRKSMRKGRRHRNTGYRHPKFRPHTKREYSEKPVLRHKHKTHWIVKTNSFTTNRGAGWLPPSVQSKVDHHIRTIEKYLKALPLDTHMTLELGRFDMQKIKNPDIEGIQYQQGRLYQYENIKGYVLARQHYKCAICGKKFGSKRKDGSIVKMKMHHMHFVSKGGTNNPDEYLGVCDQCHTPEAHDTGALEKLRRKVRDQARGMRDMTMMNIVTARLKKAFPKSDKVSYTYGNITNADRKQMRLPKAHAYDAVAIAKHAAIVHDNDYTVHDDEGETMYVQHRKKKRSLHEANPRKGRKTPNREAKRNNKNTKRVGNVCLLDMVSVQGKTGIVTSFTNTSCRVDDRSGKKIPWKAGETIPVSQICVKYRNNNWIAWSLTNGEIRTKEESGRK